MKVNQDYLTDWINLIIEFSQSDMAIQMGSRKDHGKRKTEYQSGKSTSRNIEPYEISQNFQVPPLVLNKKDNYLKVGSGI